MLCLVIPLSYPRLGFTIFLPIQVLLCHVALADALWIDAIQCLSDC
uniref:Uncharacterized protein n=1 Tax=Arundo donax TaxID=35708 RepID=A0A0A9HJJ7_ARUDO